MATDPIFATTPRNSSITTNALAETSTTSPTNFATIFSAGANGSVVVQLRIMQVLTTASAGILNIFVFDNTNNNLFDSYAYGTGTVDATHTVVPLDVVYNNLILPVNYSLRVTNTVLSNTGGTLASTHKLTAIGGDF